MERNRRDFLLSALTLVGTGPQLLLAAQEKPVPLIDTHTHFYDPTRPQGVPWPSKEDKLLYRRVLPRDYQALARHEGVTGTVVVEASAWVEDNQWLLDLAKAEPFIVGIVGRLQPGHDDFPKHLRRFAANRLFRGIRIGVAEVRKGLEQQRFRDDLKRLQDQDLELDVNGGPDMPTEVARLAQLLPGLRIVINHAANLAIDGKPVPAAWLAGMRAAARHKLVYCKVSALAEGAGRRAGHAPKDPAFYKPVLDALWETFGPDRLIYGSNWPVSERFAPYPLVQGLVRNFFQAKGQAALDKFFWGNALAAYKWVKR